MKSFKEFLVENIVDNHIKRLADIGHDKEAYYKFHDEMVNNKELKKDHLDEIGKHYVMSPEFPRLFKSRNDKLDAIKQTFHDRKNFEDRGKVIDKLLPWQ